tara:strand:+ start:9259 stop:10077 length:819 start_codon:yes stop_codon:yes gene_type:complete
MKHNKKRNTAFIYEILTKDLTRAIINKDTSRKEKVTLILKEFYKSDSVLGQELQLYRVLLETSNIQTALAERLLSETKAAYGLLDEKAIFGAQSQLIGAVNKELGQDTWNNFVPNFKSLASINAIFNSKAPVKKRVLFEQSIVDTMSAQRPLMEDNKLKSIDNLAYNSFIKKFNDKYGTLLREQKDLLNQYIASFADEGFELRLYLNEELGRLKKILGEVEKDTLPPLISQKVTGVVDYLEGFRRRDFSDDDLRRVLNTQQLVQELVANDNN